MQKSLTLIDKDGFEEAALLIVGETPEPFIELRSDAFNSGEISCEKLYKGFQELHKLLDNSGLKLLCMGFRYDVRPSGMAMSMGHGTLAYVLKLGQPAMQMVDIFDSTDEAEAVVTYQEQISFHKKWAESLKQSKGNSHMPLT